MTLSGVLLGLINIGIVVLILLLVGALILWFCSWLNFPIPAMVQKLYIAIVALIALYMLVALLLGIATPLRVIGGGPFWFQAGKSSAAAAAATACPTTNLCRVLRAS